MDDRRFDALARLFSGASERRSLLSRLPGLLALLVGTRPRETAAQPNLPCRSLGRVCVPERGLTCCPGAVCRDGHCACPRHQRRCGRRCIGRNQCCTNRDCRGEQDCRRGRCRCPHGQRPCGKRCIPNGDCCRNRDCDSCATCRRGRCVAGCPAGQECRGGECRCTRQSCRDGCCDGDQCRPGDQDGTCGRAGEPCHRCGENETCRAGSCKCAAGFKPCNGTCVPDTICCDCTTCENRTPCPNGGTCCNGTCCDGCCGTNGSCGPCIAFVTDATYASDLDGLTGADAECQDQATGAGLPGTYRAWLSDGSGSPVNRFRRSGQPYVLVDGTEIAANWTDLTTEKPDASFLAHPLDRTQTNEVIEFDSHVATAWTATGTHGGGDPNATTTCAGWESMDHKLFGFTGFPHRDSAEWTFAGFIRCGVDPSRLYCFQQD